MHVLDDLMCDPPIVLEYVYALTTGSGAYGANQRWNVAQHRGGTIGGHFIDRDKMLLRYQQDVSVTQRSNIHESKRPVIIKNLAGWNITGSDLAEEAIWIFAHLITP